MLTNCHRRAKLKRMNSDDRERVLNSRALPEGFQVLQTLPNYPQRMLGTPSASPTEYSPQTGISRKSRFQNVTFPKLTSALASQTSNNSVANWGLSFTPSTASSSDLMSPQSTPGDRSYLYGGTNLRPSSSATNPYAHAPSSSDAYRSRMHRLDTTNLSLSRGEPMSAPVKGSNSSYTGSSLDYDYSLSASTHPINALGFVEPPRSVPTSGDHANAFVSGYSMLQLAH
jgi:hypothetical protein